MGRCMLSDGAGRADGTGMNAPRTALAVDDSSVFRSYLRRTLTQLGYDVHESANGREALEHIERCGPVDLAVVDWNMPVMDGLVFVQVARAERGNDDMVVLMVSSESDPDAIAHALVAGADGYAVKPITPETLSDEVEIARAFRLGICAR